MDFVFGFLIAALYALTQLLVTGLSRLQRKS